MVTAHLFWVHIAIFQIVNVQDIFHICHGEGREHILIHCISKKVIVLNVCVCDIPAKCITHIT